MVANAAAAKYVLTTHPPLPSKCIGCGKGSDGKTQFIDTGVSEDYYGAIVFCIDCSREISTVIGYVSVELSSRVAEENDTLKKSLEESRQKVEALEDVVRVYGLGQFVLPDAPDSVLASDEVEGQDDSESGDKDSNTGKSEPGLFE